MKKAWSKACEPQREKNAHARALDSIIIAIAGDAYLVYRLVSWQAVLAVCRFAEGGLQLMVVLWQCKRPTAVDKPLDD